MAIGPGFAAYAEGLAPLLAAAVLVLPDVEPSAREGVVRLGAADLRAGRGLDAGAALPVYLRDNVAKAANPAP